MTIKQEWERFERMVLPVPCSDIQREECRRAFYAGTLSMLTLVSRASHEFSIETATAKLEGLNKECHAFFDEVGGGKA